MRDRIGSSRFKPMAFGVNRAYKNSDTMRSSSDEFLTGRAINAGVCATDLPQRFRLRSKFARVEPVSVAGLPVFVVFRAVIERDPLASVARPAY